MVDLCGHATLASAHFLLTSGITEAQTLEFVTRSGILKATKLDIKKKNNTSRPCNDGGESFLIELNFPLIEAVNLNSTEIPAIPKTLNGLSMVNVQKGNQNDGDIIVHAHFFDFFVVLWIVCITLNSLLQSVIKNPPLFPCVLILEILNCMNDQSFKWKVLDFLKVELPSGDDVTNLKPNFDELCNYAGRGVIVTAPAPPGSGFDFFSRFFCPKFGINEDPVTGSAHCLLAPYWGRKLGKQNLTAYQASPRGGILKLQLDEKNQRVLIAGEAVTVMTGTLFV